MKTPLFVFMGDSFLCEEKRKEILLSLKKEFGSEIPLSIRHAGEVHLETLFGEARTLPFLAPAQAFCLRDSQEFSKSDLELLGTYFASPHPQSFFILEAESLAKDHPFLDWAKRGRGIYSLQREGEKVASDFIRNKLKLAKKRMSAEALSLLESRIGDSFVFLDSVMDQLILYSSEKEEIDLATVQLFEERLDRLEGNDLIGALAERNLTRALQVVDDLLEVSVRDVSSLIGLIHWQFRSFWEAQKLLQEGIPEREVAFRLKFWPSRAATIFKQLKSFSLKDLEKSLEGLFLLDWQLKSGRAEGRYEIENWLVNAIG